MTADSNDSDASVKRVPISWEALEDAFVESGHHMQDLLVEIVASPAFRVVAEPE